MKRGFKIAAIVVGVLIILLAVVPFLIPVNQFRPTIEQKASTALGRKVEVGNLSLSLLSGSLGADNLSIADDPKFSNSPFLTAKSVKVGVEIMPLILSKTLNVTEVVIDSPQVMLIRSAGGDWNYSSLSGSSAEKTPAKPTAASPSSSTPASSSHPGVLHPPAVQSVPSAPAHRARYWSPQRVEPQLARRRERELQTPKVGRRQRRSQQL